MEQPFLLLKAKGPTLGADPSLGKRDHVMQSALAQRKTSPTFLRSMEQPFLLLKAKAHKKIILSTLPVPLLLLAEHAHRGYRSRQGFPSSVDGGL